MCDVGKRIAYWEAVPDRTPGQEELLHKFYNARAVMKAGGECPMQRATLYTMLEALAIVGSQFGRPVGPSRETNKSPAQLVADFMGADVPVLPAVHLASRERARKMLAVIHAPLVDAGIATDGTSQDVWRAKGMT
ncbi:hypothetical protein [Deinococcus wulumuqiensis]|nr:hypothetical protein [Deinococcus wulumuqiensis]QII20029.1 hypothetical protein G6R31_04085 [Deinococcus wulumuqiensis R12]